MWKEYTGDYQKEFYDVLSDGFVYTQVWPNAGYFRKAGLTLCSDEDRKPISIRESPIHAALINMDSKILLSEYESIVENEDSIQAYIKIRQPIADEEHRLWEEEQEKERAKHYLNIIVNEDGTWGERPIMYLSNGIKVPKNKPYK